MGAGPSPSALTGGPSSADRFPLSEAESAAAEGDPSGASAAAELAAAEGKRRRPFRHRLEWPPSACESS